MLSVLASDSYPERWGGFLVGSLHPEFTPRNKPCLPTLPAHRDPKPGPLLYPLCGRMASPAPLVAPLKSGNHYCLISSPRLLPQTDDQVHCLHTSCITPHSNCLALVFLIYIIVSLTNVSALSRGLTPSLAGWSFQNTNLKPITLFFKLFNDSPFVHSTNA